MIQPLLAFLLLALTRAEIIERFKAPVVKQANGLIHVYADCPEDMRREYQMPIAGFAAETVKALYAGGKITAKKFNRAGIIIHVGDERTNRMDVVTKVRTNDNAIVTRIYVKSPGFASLDQLRLSVIKGFFRSVQGREYTDKEAISAYRRSHPVLRIADDRQRLEDWLVGRGDLKDDEEGLKLRRKIMEPGKASRRDVLTFASRLYLYPPTYDLRFMGKFSSLSFREALKFAKIDPMIGMMAFAKSVEVPVFGGGRGDEMTAAAEAYRVFLIELARQKVSDEELRALLDAADEKLNIAFEKAK